MDQETSRNLVEQAHQVCPCSNATCGNNPVELVVEQSGNRSTRVPAAGRSVEARSD